MWIKTNPNPCGRYVGDCSVRAVAVALDVSWEEAFDLLADSAYIMCDMPSSNSVIGAVLRTHGFYMSAIPKPCTVAEFARENPRGIYVLFKLQSGQVPQARYQQAMQMMQGMKR